MSNGVLIVSLGCRSNQYEGQKIGNELLKNGLQVFYDAKTAENILYIVLNTCSITAMADKKSRQFVAKLKTKFEGAKLIVCGCSVKNDKTKFENKDIWKIFEIKDKPKIAKAIIEDIKEINCNYSLPIINQHGRDKLFLKIQDGCNNFCSYCIVPYLRGRSVSRKIPEILAEAKSLAKRTKEIVLTAINISDFKENGEYALSKLVKMLAESLPKTMFSFGSLYPSDIGTELLSVIKSNTNIKTYFHLSMQSGSNAVLRHMNRHYTKEEFIAKVDLIREVFPSAEIECDVIVGYPIETDENFNETVETIKRCNFSHMHIFEYSPRSGTLAYKLKPLADSIRKERMRVLLEMNRK